MKKLSFILCALCAFPAFMAGQVVGNTFAQTTYSVFTYKEPKGYKKEKNNGYISYTKTNETKGTYCIIAFYEQTKASATIDESFETNWQELVAQPYSVTNAPEKETQPDQDGWKVKTGGASFTFSSGPCAAFLTTLQQGTADANILYISNTQDFINDFDALMNSVKMSKAKVIATTTPTKPNEASNTPNNKATNVQADLWFTYTLSGTKYMTMDPKFYLVYPNGDFKDEAPWEGLISFNVANNKKEFPLGWGKFVMNKSGDGSFTINNYVEKLKRISADKMDRLETTWDYLKCKSVDNLKLQGSYSPTKNWSTNTYFNSLACKNLLTLNKDGSFKDHGFFVGICDNPSTNPKDAPGSGTYIIQNFTLQLKYSDGRITERLLCGVANANPTVENSSLFIGHTTVYNK